MQQEKWDIPVLRSLWNRQQPLGEGRSACGYILGDEVQGMRDVGDNSARSQPWEQGRHQTPHTGPTGRTGVAVTLQLTFI